MNTILLDLDGTLLPMDTKIFQTSYFKRLCANFRDVEPRTLYKALLSGTTAMYLNDGSRTNREVFAEVFSKNCPLDYYKDERRFLNFYLGDFQKCAGSCEINGYPRAIVSELSNKGYRLVLAANPVFPEIATFSRLSWLNLDSSEFVHISTVENTSYCKTNPDYYRDLLERVGAKPEDCIMIGNEVEEDGMAYSFGIPTILVKDYLVNPRDIPLTNYTLMNLEELLAWARSLPEADKG